MGEIQVKSADPPASALNVEPYRGTSLFLGHPTGLAFLAFTEAWERFSFYGMSSLLLLYMIQYLLTPDVAANVHGLAAVRAGVEALAGPLSNQAFASQLLGLYTALVYFTPILGGLLADRWIGRRAAVVAGAAMMAGGHFLMAFDASFILALTLMIVGTGCLKGNISSQIGLLYNQDDESRRTRAFTIFSAAINFGALTGPIACGILAQVYGWHAGFGAASVLMVVALATYLAGWRHLPTEPGRGSETKRQASLKVGDWRTIAALTAIMLITMFPIAAYYQEFNAGLLFIEHSVDRKLWGFTVPTATFVALDGFFCILLVLT
nr:oligopeptide:H+ symporter [Sphingosinicella soli]